MAEASDHERDTFLGQTLWKSRFRYERPRRLPRTREWLARARWLVASRTLDFLHDRTITTSGHHVDIDHFHPDRVWYEPSSWSHLGRVLKARDVQPDDVFVDYGCGKGRVVYQAARLPFKRVVGVEIAEDLAAIARSNIDAVRGRLRCPDVEIVTADAVDWPLPDDVTVAYLYYPFVGETFERVIDNIVESLGRRPRRFTLIYAIPTMEDYVLATGRFSLAGSVRIRVGGLPQRMAVYSAKPLPSPGSRDPFPRP